MAVENKYVNADIVAEKKAVAAFSQGAQDYTAIITFEVAAADDNASVYRLMKNIAPDMIIEDVQIFCDAITGGTDWDLGLYKNLDRGGAVIDKDVFLDAGDLSSALIRGAGLDGMSAVNIVDSIKRVYEHAGDTLSTRELGYDLALTANVVGTAAGTITVIVRFVQG